MGITGAFHLSNSGTFCLHDLCLLIVPTSQHCIPDDRPGHDKVYADSIYLVLIYGLLLNTDCNDMTVNNDI